MGQTTHVENLGAERNEWIESDCLQLTRAVTWA